MRHQKMVQGIIAPNGVLPGRSKARVLNTGSHRRAEPLTHSRLDGLLNNKNPKICVYRRLGGIGDVIMTTPMLKHIKRLMPNCHLVYATDLKYSNAALGDVMRHNPYIDELVSAYDVSAKDFDFFTDVTATGLDREKPGTIPLNRIDMFAQQAGIDISSDPLPTYIVDEEEREWAIRKTKEYCQPKERKDIFLVGIQMRSNDKRRSWPKEHVIELAKILTKDKNTRVVIFSWEDDKPNLPQVFMFGAALPYTAALIEQCDVMVCPDSSLLHIAGALQKKTIAIFGPIPPESRVNYYNNTTALIAGLPCQYCVTGDSLVLTSKGYKEIKDIKEEEKIKTTSGKYHKTIKTHKNKRGDRDLHEIDYVGSNESIICTDEHKILISRKEDTIKDVVVCTSSNPQWIEAKDIKEGDYLCLPRNKYNENKEERYPSLDLDKYWLLGLYLAEGHHQWHKTEYKREYSIRFTLGNHERELIDKARKILESFGCKTFENKSKQDNSTQIWINSKEITKIFRDMFGKNTSAKTKFIPEFIKYSRTQQIEAFLKGYFDGDGYLDPDGVKVYTTKSKHIAYGIQELYTRKGILAKVYHRTRDTNFKQNADIYRVYVKETNLWSRWSADDNYLYTPVKQNILSERKDEFVYDITIEKNPTFTINNIAIYDCWYRPTCGQNQTCMKEVSPEAVAKAVLEKRNEEEKVRKVLSINTGRGTGFKPDNVVLVKRHHGGFGDIMMTLPGIEKLKEKYPTKKLWYALPEKFMCVAENSPYIDKVLDIHKPLQNNRYSIVMDISSPCAQYESSRVSQGKRVELNRVEVFAEALGTRGLLENIRPKYYPTEEEMDWAKNFLPPTEKPRIAIALRPADKYREWPREKFEKLIPLLTEDFQCVIVDPVRDFLIPNVVDGCGFQYRKAAAIVLNCDIVLTPNSSILALSAAHNIPTIATFGPLDPRAIAKMHDNVTVVRSECQYMPCWRNNVIPCKQTKTAEGYSQCMKSLGVEAVYEAIQETARKLK